MDQEHTSNGKIRKSLEICWKEGIPASIMLGIMEYYLVPYGLLIGATVQQIGLLVSIPSLLASIAQLFAVRAVRFAGSRLRFLTVSSLVQATLLVPVAFLSFVPVKNQVLCLILLVFTYKLLDSLIGTAWGSLVSDYLPAEKRGHYFGWRSQIVGVSGILGVGLGGALLFLANHWPKTGFFLLFLGAAACRFLSSFLMSKMTDLPLAHNPRNDFTLFMFLRRFRESNFVKYVLYVASITFATQLAAPYFSVYMLRDLRLDYLRFMLIHLAAVFSGLFAFPIWGKHADMIGNARILKMTGLLIPIIPVLWLFSNHFFYLIAIQIFSGFVWGGFNLCAANFIYDSVSAPKRVRCLGYFNLINGTAIFLGATIGGFLASRLPAISGFTLLSLFLLSGILRLFAYFFLSSHFQEVRKTTRHVSSLELFFSVVGIRPLTGIAEDWRVFPLVKKPREAASEL